jgi:rare lipoprotein A
MVSICGLRSQSELGGLRSKFKTRIIAVVQPTIIMIAILCSSSCGKFVSSALSDERQHPAAERLFSDHSPTDGLWSPDDRAKVILNSEFDKVSVHGEDSRFCSEQDLTTASLADMDAKLDYAPPFHGEIVGAASWYNPYQSKSESGESETASGEQYDPAKWTAAIQIELRREFGGVRYGKSYEAAYALVESRNKLAIVKVNDVGPLKPGRIIDLSERAMRYFDQSLEVGILPEVKVTYLLGKNWSSGPITKDDLVSAELSRAPANTSVPRGTIERWADNNW